MAASKKKVMVLSRLGYVWRIDAYAVAHHRAEFYEEDGYQREYDYTLNDDTELWDWYFNQMNWEDIPAEARALVTVPTIGAPEELTKLMEGRQSEWDFTTEWVEVPHDHR